MINPNPNTLDSVRKYIASELIATSTPIADDQELLMSGMLDSINVMRLVGYLETEFSTSIPPEDVLVENFGTISQISTYIETNAIAS